MTLRAILRGADYLYLCRFASTEETRFYLNGVHVDCANGRLVSTDGHRLGLLKPDDGEFAGSKATGESFILSASKDLQRAAKGTRYGPVWLRCWDDRVELIEVSSNLDLTAADLEAYTGAIKVSFPASAVYVDGTFPDYARVIPTEPSGKPCNGFNAAYMSSFAGPDKDKPMISVIGDGPSGPMLVGNADPRFVGVLMPARANGEPAEVAKRCRIFLGVAREEPALMAAD